MRAELLAGAVIATALAACAAQPAPGPASAPIGHGGSAAHGLAYAQAACASCHAVGAGELVSPHPLAPPFQRVADTPGMTGLALHVWLRSPHENMPQIVVAPEQVEHLAAYLGSIESR